MAIVEQKSTPFTKREPALGGQPTPAQPESAPRLSAEIGLGSILDGFIRCEDGFSVERLRHMVEARVQNFQHKGGPDPTGLFLDYVEALIDTASRPGVDVGVAGHTLRGAHGEYDWHKRVILPLGCHMLLDGVATVAHRFMNDEVERFGALALRSLDVGFADVAVTLIKLTGETDHPAVREVRQRLSRIRCDRTYGGGEVRDAGILFRSKYR